MIINSVDHLEKKECCGCKLCENICPTNCISMRVDEEGFWYPDIDNEKCIKCRKCVSLCPGISERIENSKLEAFIGYNMDEKVRRESSSGGLFWELANIILQQSGAVYGALYNECLNVEHARVLNRNDLYPLLKSKYIQSDMGGEIYSQIIQDLRNGKKVLFCGTPCQVGAVSNLVNNYGLSENLYLVDFICHGVSSPGVWKSYLNYMQKKHMVETINFRDKSHGWHDYHVCIEFDNGDCICKSHEIETYMRTFLSNKNLRPSCYNCAYKRKYLSDITLGDAWKIQKEKMEWSDDKGISLFIVRTDKGNELRGSLSKNFTYDTTDYTKWISWNPSLEIATQQPSTRKEFFESFKKNDKKAFWEHNKKVSIKKLIKYIVKCLLRKLGIDNIVRKIF